MCSYAINMKRLRGKRLPCSQTLHQLLTLRFTQVQGFTIETIHGFVNIWWLCFPLYLRLDWMSTKKCRPPTHPIWEGFFSKALYFKEILRQVRTRTFSFIRIILITLTFCALLDRHRLIHATQSLWDMYTSLMKRSQSSYFVNQD